MTISELIEELEQIKVKQGDIEVVVNGDSGKYVVSYISLSEYLVYEPKGFYTSVPAVLIE